MLYQCKHERDGIILFDGDVDDFKLFCKWILSCGLYGTKKTCWECYQEEHRNKVDTIKSIRKTLNTISVIGWQ